MSASSFLCAGGSIGIRSVDGSDLAARPDDTVDWYSRPVGQDPRMARLVSVIMTVYNRQRFLPTAIESVMGQTYRDFEFVIWDDGSTDQTVDIARRYAEQDDRIRLIEAEHLGRGRALHGVTEAARGEYIGWLDSDDLLAPTALEDTAAVLDAKPDVGVVYSDYMDIDEDGNIGDYGRRCSVPYSSQRLLTHFMTFHFRLFRRSVADEIGPIDVSLACAHDYDLCLRMSEVTSFHHLRKVLYYYRVHADTISHGSRINQIEGSRQAVEKALVRRGLSDKFRLDVEIVGRFRLVARPHEADKGDSEPESGNRDGPA